MKADLTSAAAQCHLFRKMIQKMLCQMTGHELVTISHMNLRCTLY
jgi:hypothetical protein